MDSAFGGCKRGRCGKGVIVAFGVASGGAAEELITRRDPSQPFHADVGTREMEREVNMRESGRFAHMPSGIVALRARSVLQLLPYDALDAWYLSMPG